MAPTIPPTQQAASTPRRSSMASLGNPHRKLDSGNKITKPYSVVPPDPGLVGRWRPLGDSQQESSLVRRTYPTNPDTPGQKFTPINPQAARKSAMNAVSTTAPASTSQTPANINRPGDVGWDHRESLKCWEMYWDADFNPINRQQGKLLRSNVLNNWRKAVDYSSGPRSWVSMEQRMAVLREKGATLEGLRASVGEGPWRNGEIAMVKKYAPGAGGEVTGEETTATAEKSTRRRKTSTLPGNTRPPALGQARFAPEKPSRISRTPAPKATKLVPRKEKPATDSSLRTLLEDQQDIATAASVTQAIGTLAHHMVHVRGADPEVVKQALMVAGEEYVERARTEGSEFWRKFEQSRAVHAEAGEDEVEQEMMDVDES